MRWLRIALFVGLVLAAASGWLSRQSPPESPGPANVTTGGAGAAAARLEVDGLPSEAADTLSLIRGDGPFPYDRDGTVFQNREGRLPDRPRGYYREYTVRTPGSSDRGARRIVSGGDPPVEFYYTDDHYRTFRRLEVSDR